MKINIDKDELYKIYITENRTKVDTAKYFNCSTSRIDGALSEYKIKKDITLAKQNRKQGVINKYGVDNVAKLTDFAERSKKSTLERYGVDCYCCGHIHSFQHIKPEGATVDYLVNSSGSLARPVKAIEGTQFCSPDEGFTLVNVADNQLTFYLINDKGEIIYQFSRQK